MKGVVFACITAILWGFLAIALKLALVFIDPITIVWFRFTMAFLTLFMIFLFTNKSKLHLLKRPPLKLLLAGLCIGVNYLCFMKGLHRIGSNATQVVIQTGPIMLAVAGIFVFKEKVNKKQVIGFVIAAIGLLVFYINNLSDIVEHADNFRSGFIWVFLAALAWVTYAILQKLLVRDHNPQSLNVVLYLIPALMFLPFADFSALAGLTLGQWGLMLFLGLNTLFAYGCLAEAFKYTQAYKVSIIVTLNPTITFVLMALFATLEVTWIQTETMALEVWIGAAMLLGGAVYSIYSSSKS